MVQCRSDHLRFSPQQRRRMKRSIVNVPVKAGDEERMGLTNHERMRLLVGKGLGQRSESSRSHKDINYSGPSCHHRLRKCIQHPTTRSPQHPLPLSILLIVSCFAAARALETVAYPPYPLTDAFTMAKDSNKPSGGLKGIIQRTGKFFYSGGLFAWKQGYTVAKMGYQVGGDFAFAIATTSMIVLMPLLFEIAREGQMLETERAQIKDFKSRGYSDRQLQELGFSESALHSPSVASLKK